MPGLCQACGARSQIRLHSELIMSLYSDYWSQAPQGATLQGPRAGFQTVWVQRQLQRIAARNAALRAQYINSSEITG